MTTRAAVLAAAFTVAGASASARADERRLPGEIDVTAGVGVAVAVDDNALLGRRGQFLDAQGTLGDRHTDVAAIQRIDAELVRRAGAGGRLLLRGRADLALLRSTDELAGWDATASLSYERRASSRLTIAPALSVRYHRDQPEWSSQLVEPSLRVTSTPVRGLLAELSYRYTTQAFARYGDGTPAPKNSYANIDVDAHTITLDARAWLRRDLRARLVLDGGAVTFGGNLSPRLADYAGIEAGAERRDLGAGVTGEALVALGTRWLVGGGARAELNASNSDAFAFRAAHALASAMFTARGHTVYLQLDLGRFEFPRAHFDRRYTNTRADVRRTVAVTYRWAITAALAADVTFRREDAVSNDCADFEPERDADGLPVYSMSYSCYGRDRLDVSLRWEL